VQEDTLIVSEASLAEKKAAYDKLIKEEIPQNREDIKTRPLLRRPSREL